MEPLRLCVAVGPLAMYFLVLGAINLRRRPLVVSGARDIAALATACLGLVIVGPLELFMPQAAATHFGLYVWGLLIALYGLCVVLVITGRRPTLVVYNMDPHELRAMVERAAFAVDNAAKTAGNSWFLESFGLEVRVEGSRSLRNATLCATRGALGETAGMQAWGDVCAKVRDEINAGHGARNPRGYALVTTGILLLGVIGWKLATQSQEVASELVDMLRL